MSGIHNYDAEIHALDERIGRLALLCGADISRPEIVTGLIKGNFSAFSRHGAATHDQQKELRALLMMKYQIEVGCIDSIGVADCAKLIFEQDERLRRSGFPPEAIERET